MNRKVYTILYFLLTPFFLLRLLWRSRKNKAYRKRWHERFALFQSPKIKKPIWIHTVSVGEFLAAYPFIMGVKKRWPHVPICVTTTTITGSNRVKEMLGKEVFHVYCPFDLPGCVNRFYKKIRPQLLILMETELWPNMLYCCKKNKVPVILANARLSQKSQRGYAKFSRLTRPMLKALTYVAVQHEADAARFINLGLPNQKIKITGSIKYDMTLPANTKKEGLQLRQQFGENRTVFIAASTHEGEEAMLLTAYLRLKEKIPNLLLLIVPRHPERFKRVAQLIKNHKLTYNCRSQPLSKVAAPDVFLGDSMGELLTYYAASDVAFVGGSLVKIGGHNPLEPAALGLPVLIGPYTHNFKEINRLLAKSGALKVVSHPTTLQATALPLLLNKATQMEMGEKAQAVIERNKGALNALLNLMHHWVYCAA